MKESGKKENESTVGRNEKNVENERAGCAAAVV